LETVLPLCVAKKSTCVVVAGDHLQIRPPVYLQKASELGRSYLERLYHYYDQQKITMEKTIPASDRENYRIPSILFNKNYRCHPEILKFLSSVFYGDANCLVSYIDQRQFANADIKPLYFVDSDSHEEISKNGSIINRGEAQAVAEQVEYLWLNWPKEWGDIIIGVAVPYAVQAGIIKGILREKRISTHSSKVDVSRVIQMQGKEYKALIISTVRGPKQLIQAGFDGNRNRNLAFLDDPRLINTAMTRAKYTVVVVGNPTVLCALGSCREIWYRYIAMCARNDAFLPDTVKWGALDGQIVRMRANMEGVNKDKDASAINADDLLISQLTKKTQRELK